jgi:hypothetical protein
MNRERTTEDDQLRSTIEADLNHLLSILTQDVKKRSQVRDSAKRLARAWSDGDVSYVSKYVNGPQGKSLIETYGDASVSIDRLRLALARNEDSVREDLHDRLVEYCTHEKLHLNGRHGSYLINGVLQVNFDLKKRSAKVGTQYIQSLDWGKIQSAIDIERERLWRRPDDATGIRNRLVAAYEKAITKHPNVTGWARLEDIYQELKRRLERETPNWKSQHRLVAYYRDEFTVDLSSLLSLQMAGKVSGTEIEFSAIRDPRLSFQVPLPDGTATSIGFMRPKGKASGG